MNARSLTACAALLLPLALALSPRPAQAAWLGLGDGDYAVLLNCEFSSVIACPSTIVGQISIGNGGMTAMDFVVDGLHFSGDPADAGVTLATGTVEVSNASVQPFASLALGLVTDGQFANWVQGDRYWSYCHHFDSNSCVPGTTGTWTARLLTNAVPEPSVLALALAGALGIAFSRRHRTGRR